MRILSIDVGGSKIKCLFSDERERRVAPSGAGYTPQQFVTDVHQLIAGEAYDCLTIGLPIPIRDGRALREPVNLGPGWAAFDYRAAFDKPTRILNDAAMQAVGSYEGGRMLFLGLGTGLGTALIDRGHLVSLEAGHLPYRKHTFEDYVGAKAKEALGKKEWRDEVHAVIAHFQRGFVPDEVVLGGGNARDLKEMPPGCRLGSNAFAFLGGWRVWEPQWAASVPEL